MLQVTIDAIRVAPRGYVAAIRGTGILGNCEVDPGIEPFDVEGGFVRFANRITLPVRPMVGTIGVAPAAGAIATLSLGDHGGNLDFNEIAVGTAVHLPIRVPGALFGIGDVHVTMGDGEAHSGVNIAADIDISISVNRGVGLSWPWFETATHVMTVGVAEDLSGAARQATAAMEQRLRCDLHVTPTQARMLAGAAVDLRLGQAGGYGVPVSVYARFPKSSIDQGDSSL
jgi:amidase